MPITKSFFDIHLHAMDLSHPNLLSFIRHIDGIGSKLMFIGLFEPFLKKQKDKVMNLLTVMENSIEDYFILLEYYLKNKEAIVNQDNTFQINGAIYNTMVLTPLLMDFGYKNYKENTFYNSPPRKPIVEQTVDVLNAIKKYKTDFIPPSKNEFEIKKRSPKDIPLFEIYPFIGINPQNYTLEKLTAMLEKYFSSYSRSREALRSNMGRFDGDIEHVGSNFFAGIKLYPPLGFDPWPDEPQLTSVKILYEYCQNKKIPITVHCSDGGFAVDNEASRRTNPKKWEVVLRTYPDLILNLAHFGKQKNKAPFIQNTEWRDVVFKLINEYEYVFTDFSCAAYKKEFYEELFSIINKHKGSIEKVLFGSDYMINLFWSKSYNSYLDLFFKDKRFSKKYKEMMCEVNPQRFLFG